VIDYLGRYGVARPRNNDVKPLGPLAEFVAGVVLEAYRRAEIERLERKLRVGADDSDLMQQYANWELWVRVGHLLQFDPGAFNPR